MPSWHSALTRFRAHPPQQPMLLAVMLIVLFQVAFAQYFLYGLARAVADPSITVTARTSTSYTDFVAAHLPPGRTVLYVSSSSTPAIIHRLLTYDLPHDRVPLYQQNSPGGLTSAGLLAAARAENASFIAFYDMTPPGDLPATASWQLQPGYSLVQITS